VSREDEGRGSASLTLRPTLSPQQFNNALMLKKRPAEAESGRYITPTDRNRKPIAKRYTTARVEGAIADYLSACDAATSAVKKALQGLSDTLRADLPALVSALHVAVVLQAAAAHVAAARQRGAWTRWLPARVRACLPPCRVSTRPFVLHRECTRRCDQCLCV
jgi:hypothetical protein